MRLGDCIATDQLLRHVIHLYQVQESSRSARHRSQHIALQVMVAAFLGLLRADRYLHHDFRRRIYGLPAWILGYTDIPL